MYPLAILLKAGCVRSQWEDFVDAFLFLLSALLLAVGAPLLVTAWLYPGAQGRKARWAELVLSGAAVFMAGMILAAAFDIGALAPVLEVGSTTTVLAASGR